MPWLSKGELEIIRMKKLRQIIRTAINTVPYYRELKLEIDLENFTINDLIKFPIVNKQLIRSMPEKFRSERYRGRISKTSGSSGEPFKFYLPFDSTTVDLVTAQRAWTMGKNYQYSPGDPIVVVRSYAPKLGEPIIKIDRKNNFLFISPFHLSEEFLPDILDLIRNSGAKIIRGYASSVYILTLLLKENDVKIKGVETVVTSSETLLPAYRELIEKYWGIPVLDWYGQSENTVTAQQCWVGNYHNNDDYGITELSDENEIIATSLNNNVMPFIRYNTGDKAIPLKTPIDFCPCGRNFSIPFAGILGRSDDILVKLDGTLIPTANFSTAMKKFGMIKQFQIVQHPNRDVTLSVVIDMEDTRKYRYQVSEIFNQRLGDVQLNICEVEAIKRDPKTGKVKVSIQEGEVS